MYITISPCLSISIFYYKIICLYQLEKAQEATDAANLRAAYAEAANEILTGEDIDGDKVIGTVNSEPMSATRTTWSHVTSKIGGHDLPSTTKDTAVVVVVDSDGNVTFDGE